ncbi:hypothetical protein EJ03DRAFT_205245 [Teratosphaeria nubilosa]|uniref:Uncharacterized protein n=1 Tax=Teratosphaeria nubilosa TaxID=161662 RepID=A0A6G1KYC4_9PEZI|nr:hypothetical protein EJ03DRAFT_205245 [Teratosphaeria nubilosa]
MDSDRKGTEHLKEMESTPKDKSSQSNTLEVPDTSHQSKASLPPTAARQSYSEILKSSPVVREAQIPPSSQVVKPSPLIQVSAQPQPPSHTEPAAHAQPPGHTKATAPTKPSDQAEPSSHRNLPEIKVDPPKDSPTAILSSSAPARPAKVEPTVLPGHYDVGLGAVVCTPVEHDKGTNTVRYQEVRQMLVWKQVPRRQVESIQC